MPFPFRFVCDLLQKLDDETRSKKRQRESSKAIIDGWFREHRKHLDAHETDAAAILSTLLPEKRTDRVYGIRVAKLESIIGRAMCLGTTRLKQLREYNSPGLDKDLADCVEHILTKSPNATQKVEITVEEIDQTLHRIAATCRFSSDAVRTSRAEGTQKADVHELCHFYTRLTARDAKWFSRLVLKDFTPVFLDDQVVLKAYNSQLPRLLAIRSDFAAAISLLQQRNQSPKLENLVKLGVKVGRQPWHKGRSIKHCADMINRRQVSCEQKIDGEYCQIHIDLSKPLLRAIQIFSKSGKDSTKDREGLHRAIRNSLKLGQKDCPIKKGCILEGELVVYSDMHKKILPFHKIRKHVSRSGSLIGTIGDSQCHAYEHLMIIYYDLLMIDDSSLLGTPQFSRFKKLGTLITTRKGHAELVQRQRIDFQKEDACEQLKKAFAKCIIARGEGLVLKPNDAYFDFGSRSRYYASCAIKLKKEYLKDFGDVGDFAVIGASYDAVTAKRSNIENLKYTHFFVACLENQKEARARTDKPKYIVTNIVSLNNTKAKYFRIYCNPAAVPLNENIYSDLDFRGLGSSEKPTVVFPDPPVFDICCFSFDKASNSRMWTMRFPQVSKIHLDRSHLDVLSFQQLQEAARDATEAPEMEDSQEMRLWLSKIENAEPKKNSVATNYDSQVTASTVSMVSTDAPTHSSMMVEDREPAKSMVVLDDTPAEPNSQHGLITPPRLSAINTSGVHGDVSASMASTTRSSSRKRLSQSAEGASLSKRPKTSSRSPAKSLSQNSNSPTKKRLPLNARDANDSQRTTMFCRSMSPAPSTEEVETTPPTDGQVSSSLSRSFHTANEPSSPSLNRTQRKMKGTEVIGAASAAVQASRSEDDCGHIRKGTKCTFAKCQFLLAPCISKYAWIHDLLRGHGVPDFVVDPADWASFQTGLSSADSTPRAGSPALGPASSVGRPRARKICLVEIRRPGPTGEFMKKIEEAGITRKNGQREWVSVYDWRILEDITNIESGAPDKGADPWRSRYVGIA